MNETVDQIAQQAICDICQTSYGFTAADHRAIIVMVVLTGVILIVCYTGVLWFAIRTRFIPVINSIIASEVVHQNSAFSSDDVPNEDMKENVPYVINATPAQTPVFTLDNENERF